MPDTRFHRLRAIIRNALTWSLAWGTAGGAVVLTIAFIKPGPGVTSLSIRIGQALIAGVAWGIRFALAGAVIGTVFSAILRWRYLGRRLSDINPLRFTLLGAVVGGVGVPLYLQMMNVVFGDGPIAWGLVTDDAVWASAFGAVAAAGSIMLARRSEALPRSPSGQAERLASGDDPTMTELRETTRARHR